MKGKSESEVAQLCPTLSDPLDCSLPGSSVHGIFFFFFFFVHGIFQARVLEWGAITFSNIYIAMYKIINKDLLYYFVYIFGHVMQCVGS